MKTTKRVPPSVDEYIAAFPLNAQPVLGRVRRTIRTAMPGAEEVISYGIPAYKLHGRTVIYFAGWKAHYSLYPSADRLVARFKNELEPYEVNAKRRSARRARSGQADCRPRTIQGRRVGRAANGTGRGGQETMRRVPV